MSYFTSNTTRNVTTPSVSTPTILPRWLLRICTPSRMLWLGPLLGIALSLPSLFSGYMLDEHFFRQNQITNSIYKQRQPWDYFNFISSKDDIEYYRERSILCSWWTDERFRMRMFRPLASLLHAAQFRYLHDNTIFMHAGCILLYGLMILIVFKIARRLSTSPAALGVTTLLFAINDAHAYTSGWITSYNTLICCVLGLTAFLMHDRWRKSGSIPAFLLYITTFIVALLFSEGALALGAYLFAYAFFIENGPLLKRVCSLLPFAFITICYLAFYTHQQFGTQYSGVYTSPGDLLSFNGVRYIGKWLGLLFAQLVSCPILNIAIINNGNIGFMIGLSVLAGLLIILKKPLQSTPICRFYFTATVLSISPFALGPMQERLLLWSGMGAAGLLGELFTAAIPVGLLQRQTLRVLAVNNIICSLLFFIPTLFAIMVVEIPSRKIAAAITSVPTVLLNAPWDINLWYAPAISSEMEKPYPEHCYMLYAGIDTVTIKRTGKKTLEATVIKGWFSEPEYSQLTVSHNYPFTTGDTVSLRKMKVTVLSVNMKGQPVHVRFDFCNPLETFAWLIWTKEGPQPCEPPAMGAVITQCVKVF